MRRVPRRCASNTSIVCVFLPGFLSELQESHSGLRATRHPETSTLYTRYRSKHRRTPTTYFYPTTEWFLHTRPLKRLRFENHTNRRFSTGKPDGGRPVRPQRGDWQPAGHGRSHCCGQRHLPRRRPAVPPKPLRGILPRLGHPPRPRPCPSPKLFHSFLCCESRRRARSGGELIGLHCWR